MLSEKLESLLLTLTKAQANRFKKYLNSPYFNENNDLVKLFNLILKKHSLNQKSSTKTAVWKQLYPEKKFNDNWMRRICSDLTRLCQDFLALEVNKNQALDKQLSIVSAVNNPKLNKHFTGAVRQVRATIKNQGLKNANYHYTNFKIEFACHLHLEMMMAKRRDFENLEKADFHLDCFYITNKLKHFCDVLGYSKILSSKTELFFFDNFFSVLEDSKYLEVPAVKSYYLTVLMLKSPDEEKYFHQLKTFLNDNSSKFSFEEQNTFYTYLKNYCIGTKINNGRADYYKELFSLYKDTLDKNLIFDKEQLDPNHYKNIITIGLHINEFEWVENFIEDYTDKLPIENQDNDRNYNLAKVYFHQENYNKVIEQLRAVEYKKLDYSLGGKLMLLKTYYELNEVTPLESLIDSFRIYLQRNRHISRDKKQQYLNVLRFTKKLYSTIKSDKEAVRKVKAQIEACKALAAKQWLLDKVREME